MWKIKNNIKRLQDSQKLCKLQNIFFHLAIKITLPPNTISASSKSRRHTLAPNRRNSGFLNGVCLLPWPRHEGNEFQFPELSLQTEIAFSLQHQENCYYKLTPTIRIYSTILSNFSPMTRDRYNSLYLELYQSRAIYNPTMKTIVFHLTIHSRRKIEL